MTLALGAVIDHCGNCTGGTTGLEYNFLKKADCAFTCALSQQDECGQCQSKRGTQRSFKDCNGNCFGRAFINKCGVCVAGLTGLDATEGMDGCGICSGDNATCSGCDGVLRSGKRLDRCNNCLHTDDRNFNNLCTTIQSVFPLSCPDTGEAVVTVFGAGLSSELKCFLEKADVKLKLLYLKGKFPMKQWVFLDVCNNVVIFCFL